LLHHDGTRLYVRASNDVTDLYLNQVTPAQLTVNRQVKKRTVTQPTFAIKEEADRSDLLLAKGSLCANGLAGVPGRPPLHDGIKSRIAHIHAPRP